MSSKSVEHKMAAMQATSSLDTISNDTTTEYKRSHRLIRYNIIFHTNIRVLIITRWHKLWHGHRRPRASLKTKALHHVAGRPARRGGPDKLLADDGHPDDRQVVADDRPRGRRGGGRKLSSEKKIVAVVSILNVK